MESRRLIVTAAAHKHGNLNLSVCGKGFFPLETFGRPTRGHKGKDITIMAEGLPEPVKTDIPSERKMGRVRWLFRKRSWVKEFVAVHRVSAGSELLLMRVGPCEYRITPLWREFTFIDLFAGIGGLRLAFEAVGGKCVFSSEIDPLARETYTTNFGDEPRGDITQISPDSIPNHDILLAGFPCQCFSIIGNRKGFGDTRGTLFFNIEQVLRAKHPIGFLLENVKQFRTHDSGRTYRTVIESLHRLGYHTHTRVLNALDYGLPQKRERTFIVGFREPLAFKFPSPFPYRLGLEAILESDDKVDTKLLASEHIKAKRLERVKKQGVEPFYPSMWHENKGGYIGVHPFSCALRANASYNYLLVNGYRRPSGRECLRLQGFPDTFSIVVPHAAIRAQAGNAVAIPVVTAIAARMMVALQRRQLVQGSLFDKPPVSERQSEEARGQSRLLAL
ncbi:MAG TPA: DNA (cytosine-5-)-methyltransferase [Sedimentisphaerales bacterium]|nr:DNA (cytosine-5-)-methyltransferase [Sedimentisphaerales bacterium]